MERDELQEHIFKHLPEGQDFTLQYWNDSAGGHWKFVFDNKFFTLENAKSQARDCLWRYDLIRVVRISRYLAGEEIVVVQSCMVFKNKS